MIGDAEFARAAMQRHEVATWCTHRLANYVTVLKKKDIGNDAFYSKEIYCVRHMPITAD